MSYQVNFYHVFCGLNDGQLVARHDDGRETVIRAKDCPNRCSMSNRYCSWTEVPHTDVVNFAAKDSSIKEVMHKRWDINGVMYTEVIWSKDEVSSLILRREPRIRKHGRFTLR